MRAGRAAGPGRDRKGRCSSEHVRRDVAAPVMPGAGCITLRAKRQNDELTKIILMPGLGEDDVSDRAEDFDDEDESNEEGAYDSEEDQHESGMTMLPMQWMCNCSDCMYMNQIQTVCIRISVYSFCFPTHDCSIFHDR